MGEMISRVNTSEFKQLEKHLKKVTAEQRAAKWQACIKFMNAGQVEQDACVEFMSADKLHRRTFAVIAQKMMDEEDKKTRTKRATEIDNLVKNWDACIAVANMLSADQFPEEHVREHVIQTLEDCEGEESRNDFIKLMEIKEECIAVAKLLS